MFRRFFNRIQKSFRRKNKVRPLNPEDTESSGQNAECPVELFLRENPRQVPENVTPIDGQTDTEKTVVPIVVEEIISEDVQQQLEVLQSEVPPAGSITPLQEQNIEEEDTESSVNIIENISSDIVIEEESSTESISKNIKAKDEVIEQKESSHSSESIIQNSEAKEQVIKEKERSDGSSKSVLETHSLESIRERTNVLEIVVQEAVQTTETAKPLQPPKRVIRVFSPFRGHDPLQRLKIQGTKEVSGKQLEIEDIYPTRGLLAKEPNKPPGAAKIGIPVFSRFQGSSLVPKPIGQERQVCPDVPPMRGPDLLQRFNNQNNAQKVPTSAIPRITHRPTNVNPSIHLGARTRMGDFELHKLLGEGNFGRVYLAEQTITRKMVALKTIPREKVCDALAVRNVMREKEILEMAKRKKNPFLIGLVTYFETPQNMCLAMDYAEGGDLSRVMTGSLKIKTRVFYTSCIVLGVQFLHENKIVHRDLKPENIMLDKRGVARITDFGLSKAGIGFGNRMCGRCGTPAYWAPEIFVKTFYNRSVDWWAVGVILYQMVVGKFPFEGESREELRDKVVNERLKLPLSLDKETCRILQGLLNKDPVKRLGSTERNAEEIKDMLFFKKMNWELLMKGEITPPPPPPN